MRSPIPFMIKTAYSLVLLISIQFQLVASRQLSNHDTIPALDSITLQKPQFELLPDDPILAMLDSMHNSRLYSYFYLVTDTSSLNKYQYSQEIIPQFSDSIYRARLAKLDQLSPMDLGYNDIVKAFINLYGLRKRELTSRILGLSHLYFPLFEETLDYYNLPLELKYLAVVESALNPTATSKARAAGLWQFMYNTGRIYNLQVTSYVDDRNDPIKSTKAACEYLRYLYSLYDNWELAMAAYNCGPGNVNKAIRRSGGKKNYWEIYNFLPRETRGYVPAFIAVNYIMNYATEHNLYPVSPPMTYFEFDSVHISERLDLKQVSNTLDISLDVLNYLNPVYKLGIIPKTDKSMVLNLPKEKVGLFIQNEKSIYQYQLPIEQQTISEAALATANANASSSSSAAHGESTIRYHRVRSGEYLSLIAKKYHVSVTDIKKWNNLRSSNIAVGQRLKIYSNETASTQETIAKPVQKESAPTANVATSQQQAATTEKDIKTEPVYYTIQNGDTLWNIAKTRGVTIDDLKRLNKGLDARYLKPGMKIIVGQEG